MEDMIDIQSIERAEELISSITGDPKEKERMLYKCADSILNKDKTQISGSADAFHNFAVSCIKICRDYLTAYEIVVLGLTMHPSNTDLLADAIKYGYNCSEFNACAGYYLKLQQIDKKYWTWRAFSFSIDYLFEECESDGGDVTRIEAEINTLASEYCNYIQDNEDSVFTQYEVESRLGDKDKAKKMLVSAATSQKPNPKCTLKYIELLINEGKYADAAKPILKLLRIPDAAESVNIGYVHYLKGLCQIALLNPTDSDDIFAKPEYDHAKVLLIYDSFYCAVNASDTYGSLKEKIAHSVAEIYNRTQYPIPEELKNLMD